MHPDGVCKLPGGLYTKTVEYEDIKAVIAGERPLPELPEEPTVPPRRVNLIIDIQERMAQGLSLIHI